MPYKPKSCPNCGWPADGGPKTVKKKNKIVYKCPECGTKLDEFK